MNTQCDYWSVIHVYIAGRFLIRWKFNLKFAKLNKKKYFGHYYFFLDKSEQAYSCQI
jgi:hypothetical protein